MEINQLKLLDLLAEQKSFKKAAKLSFVSTSTIIRQVSAMETELGFPLFSRSPYGIALTGQGETFYHETRGVVEAYETAVRNARSSEYGQSVIRIGTYNYIRRYITRICSRLKELYPSARFSFVSCRFTDSCELLHSRSADLILLGETQEADKSIYAMPVLRTYNVVNVSEKHPFAEKKEVRCEELNGQTILLTKTESAHKNTRTVKKLFSTRCPDSEIIEFDHPDQADALCMLNNAMIASISLLDIEDSFRRIRIADAPRVEIGLMCRREDAERMRPMMESCRALYRTDIDPERVELI
ncbi:MAG: LysR family transcriptional regulator [Oscillospiraceae bacterium]|nr:LysR family transcriptional regulator [Oscillospiraceae bacterium]